MQLLLDTLLRALIALIGGYVFTNLGAVAFATVLPSGRVDSALVSIQISFALYACALVWICTARSAWQAIAGLLCAGALCSPVLVLLLNGRFA